MIAFTFPFHTTLHLIRILPDDFRFQLSLSGILWLYIAMKKNGERNKYFFSKMTREREN